MRFCALVTSPLYLFITTKRFFEILIALDRFGAVFFPMRYKTWSDHRFGHKILIGVGFAVGLSMALLVAVDVYDEVQLLFCSPRNSISVLLQLTHQPFIMAAATATGLIYIANMMWSSKCVRI